MSHFATIKTRIVDVDSLVKGLKDIGFGEVEVYDIAQHLYGYQGYKRNQTAEIIIRRKLIGSASNDIGFKKQDDGTFDAIISEYDRRKYSEEWLNKLTQRYAYHVAMDKLVEQGFSLINEEKAINGQIHLTLRRMAEG